MRFGKGKDYSSSGADEGVGLKLRSGIASSKSKQQKERIRATLLFFQLIRWRGAEPWMSTKVLFWLQLVDGWHESPVIHDQNFLFSYRVLIFLHMSSFVLLNLKIWHWTGKAKISREHEGLFSFGLEENTSLSINPTLLFYYAEIPIPLRVPIWWKRDPSKTHGSNKRRDYELLISQERLFFFIPKRRIFRT